MNYKQAYEEYVKYAKKHNLTPYTINTIQTKIYNEHPEAWNWKIKDKIKLWYNHFKPNHPNAVKDVEVWRYYTNYKGDKISRTAYLNRIRKWAKKEDAIEHKKKSVKKQYYIENKHRARVDYSVYSNRCNIRWDMEKALTTPKIKQG